MRRLIYICLFVAIVPWIVIGIVREASDDDTADHYLVRAIFDNASTIVHGEDEKVAVTLRIDNEDFTPFKADASCTIRLQGLIGERFVECEHGSTGAREL